MNIIVQPQPPIVVKPILSPIIIQPITPGPQGPGGGTTTVITSGESFSQLIPSGVNSYSFNFPTVFQSVPNLQLSFQIPSTSQNMYMFAINSKSVSGMNVEFSEVIQETGCYLNVWCN